MRSLLAPFVLRRLKSELAEQMVTKNHKLHEVREEGTWLLKRDWSLLEAGCCTGGGAVEN